MDSAAVTVAVLAAGAGSRFGGGKLDAITAGKPLGCWVLEAVSAAGLAPGICVTGPNAPRFLEQSGEWTRVVNPAPDQGLGTSIATVARLAMHRGSEALLLLLADMPLVPASHLRALVARTTPAATRWEDGAPGVPALFPATLLPALSALSGDHGARSVLSGLPDLAIIDAPPGSLLDVDTPADLARAERVLSGVQSVRSQPEPGRGRQ